ncbi:MAG: Gfo/Idh/MocA family oxidoreductase [Lentisphaerae bacterium]|jgi:predicted dehydrogenase|nr:Gfo/Idh/MocA family oxidoreductase [Lentisphaerota bacterium]
MIRVGMIGCGSMARNHCVALQPLAERMRFTAFADIDPERAGAAAARYPGALAVKDYKLIFDDVDAVVIAVPHDLHHRIGLDCLKAGKHVLMEKPLALTEGECRELIAADHSPHPVLMLGYVMRHNPMWTRFGECLRDETFGKVFHVSIWTEQYTDTSRAAWLGEARRVGGGQLFSHGCHYIDLLLHWLGDPVCGTHIGTNLGTPWMEREGTSDVSLKFASGATAYHFGTWGARGTRLGYAVHAHCTEGMLELDGSAGTITLHRSRTDGDLPALEALAAPGEALDKPDQVVVYRRPDEGGKAVVEQMAAFLDCIEQERKPEISAAASLRSLQVIWKLYEAEEQMRVADLRGI